MTHRELIRVVRVVVVVCMLGASTAASAAQDLATLLKPADLEKFGLKHLAPDSDDPEARSEQMGLVRTFDSSLIVSIARIDSGGSGAGLRTSLEIISKDVTPVTGVGDEAYLILGGWGLAFRKGGTTLQLMTGANPSGPKPFLSKDQLVELGKVVAGRL